MIYSNSELVGIIKSHANRLSDYKDNQPMFDRYVEKMNRMIAVVESRIEDEKIVKTDELSIIANEIINEILIEEGKLPFTIAMYQSLIDTARYTINNNGNFRFITEGLSEEESGYIIKILK